MSETDSRFYELMVIISGDLTEKEFEKELDEVRGMLKEAATAIDYEESWGKRDLAFKIKRQGRGFYVIFDFHALPEAIKELTANVKLHPTVLRHIIVSLPEDYVSGSYKTAMVHRRKQEQDEQEEARVKRHAATAQDDAEAEARSAKNASKAAKSEKNLDEIVSNPDINVG